MKTIPIALQSNYDGTPTTAIALRLTRADAVVYGFTGAQKAITISGVTYSSARGLDETSLTSTAGFAVDNLELVTIDDGTVFAIEDVINGLWRGASFLLFRYNWKSPPATLADCEMLMAGVIGDVSPGSGTLKVELRGLQQYLQQAIGSVSSKTCRARFADFPTPAGANRCRLAYTSYNYAKAVSAVTSRQQFASSALWTAVPVDDYFGEGVLIWTAGANVGAKQKVRVYTTSGAITLSLPMARDIQVGDTFEVVAGCRKRRDEDCVTKFGNGVNFAGEPDLPGVDALAAVPDVNV